MPYNGPGNYQHYKGGLYRVEGLAIAEDDKDKLLCDDINKFAVVVYRPLAVRDSRLHETKLRFWTRPLANFNTYMTYAEKLVPRFHKLRE